MGKLERKYLAHFIDAGMGGAVTRYVRLGKDLETYSEELNPQVSIQRNLKGTPNVVMDGYQVQSQVENYYAYSGDLLFEVLSYIANDRLTDDSCKTTKVDALYDENGEQIWAYREDCWIVPTSVGGDTSGVQIPFSVYCEGNRTYGTFDLDARTFTPEDEPERPSGGGTVELVVTENGKYVAPENTAYSPVIVQVSSAAGDAAIAKYIEGAISGYVYNSYVSSVGKYAFADNSRITGVEFPAATSIGYYAFDWCSRLVSVSMESCTTIGFNAFRSCSMLEQINMSACRTIESEAFRWCNSLSVVSFPNCSRVRASAFYGTAIENLFLPNVSFLNDHYVFEGCSKLVSLSLPALRGIQGSWIFSGCTSLKSINFPSLTSLGGNVFTNANVENVKLPVCSYVGSYAFAACSTLQSVSIPVCSVIGSNAFYGCSNLKSVYVPSLISLYSGAFCGCGLEEVSFPLITGGGNYPFSGASSLTKAYFSNLRTMGYHFFRDCQNLTDVSVPSVIWVGQSAFWSCRNLSKLSLPNCSIIYQGVFSRCYRLISLYLMSTSMTVLSDAVVNTFRSTPMYDYSAVAGRWGTIYVPASLLTAYQTNDKWSVISSRFSGI